LLSEEQPDTCCGYPPEMPPTQVPPKPSNPVPPAPAVSTSEPTPPSNPRPAPASSAVAPAVSEVAAVSSAVAAVVSAVAARVSSPSAPTEILDSDLLRCRAGNRARPGQADRPGRETLASAPDFAPVVSPRNDHCHEQRRSPWLFELRRRNYITVTKSMQTRRI
jgi:hypothetical protein